jgi:ribosomal protein S17E
MNTNIKDTASELIAKYTKDLKINMDDKLKNLSRPSSSATSILPSYAQMKKN